MVPGDGESFSSLSSISDPTCSSLTSAVGDENACPRWRIDPIAQTLEALQLENSRWVILGTCGGVEVVRLPPFEAIELDLAVLWDIQSR
jgi:hypothetical protein